MHRIPVSIVFQPIDLEASQSTPFFFVVLQLLGDAISVFCTHSLQTRRGDVQPYLL